MENSFLSISKGKIMELYNLCKENKKSYDLDYIFQITNLRKCDTNRKGASHDVCTATLSDSIHKYNGFLLFTDDNKQLKENDFIKISQIQPSLLTDGKSKIYLIKKYEFVTECTQLIGNPELYKENTEDALPQNLKIESNGKL